MKESRESIIASKFQLYGPLKALSEQEAEKWFPKQTLIVRPGLIVGPRDETKMRGGLGPCGLTLCCSTFLKGFHPVTIKMAKNQNLSLNPSKISGMCGRLMCCLAYEDEGGRPALEQPPAPLENGQNISAEAPV